MRKRPASERFWEKVNKDGPFLLNRPDLGCCWLWTARHKASNGGHYAMFSPRHGADMLAARFAYEELRGPIETGYVPDHLCLNPPCVNPWHLEIVTVRENILRGTNTAANFARRTHCDKGHPYSEENTRITTAGARLCRICRRETNRAEKARYKVGRPDLSNAAKTHCKRGHVFDEANTHIASNGARSCRICNRTRALAVYYANRAH